MPHVRTCSTPVARKARPAHLARSHVGGGLQSHAPQRMLELSYMKPNLREPSKHVSLSDHIVTDREILGGEPVFRGTRVPVVSLFEHLEGDCPLDEFLECFPSVSREAAVAVLMGAQELTLERARA